MRADRLISLLMPAALLALAPMQRVAQGSVPGPSGISAGKPKVFDNRTLTIMLTSLSQTLQSMQTQSIDPKVLAAAIANIQGFHSTTSGFLIDSEKLALSIGHVRTPR
jgi:hypothetical protein